MKKSLLFSAMLFAGLSANAQMADGSTAPNFTATDLNGNSHTLYDYLNAGKSVIIDISATWCGPCWGYHNTHALGDFYNAYGPDGSDEAMVFYVEGDGSTTNADLHGTGGNTQGDWVTGTPYPILDNASIANAFEIGYYPTIYRICPDGLVYEIGQMSAAQLKATVNTNCGALAGAQNHVQANGGELSLCSTTAAPQVSFKNFGSNAVTSATLVLKENGTTVGTAPFTGNVAQFASGTATFPTLTVNPASDYTVEITTVNGGAVHNADLATDEFTFLVAETAVSNSFKIDIVTDAYGSETTWELRNASNVVVASGGPYADLSAAGETVQPTVYANGLTADECYTFIIEDSYGDGICCSYGDGSYTIKDANNNVLLTGGSFATEADGVVKAGAAASGIDELGFSNFSVFPNPATDVVNVSFEALNADYTVSVVDLQGRVMNTQSFTNLSGSQSIAVPVGSLAKGSYLVTVSSNGGSKSQNVVIR